MSSPVVLMMFLAYGLSIYLFAQDTDESQQSRAKVTYKYEKPKDWAEDSTVSYSKKNYCEYVYNQEEL
jgi:hypothetical protein